ncbi:hypothetical protein OPV22_009947 [Ensete ventricosum]|uniref:Uncharacterized protein n=1 Tax=Ensete ventricosum TaxID=4639 RepID=A0AAV8RC91_ENSVE|nr:hypothetical protein OPV22_009947 [Ensete ventricosum]
MDWDLKMPPWNLEELGRDAELSIGSVVVGSSGGGACQSSGLDCSVDLKLGGGTGRFWVINRVELPTCCVDGDGISICSVEEAAGPGQR